MRRAAALLLVLSLFSCKKRSEDQVAKQRIFSPEEPVGALAEAKEALDAGRLAEDPRLAERVVRMAQAEVAARLGAHKAHTRVQFAWFRGPGAPDGGSDVTLAEEASLLKAPNGDFSVRQEKLAHGLKLQKSGEVTIEGRRMVRYQVTGSAGRPPPAERTDLPKLEYPLQPGGGHEPDPDTARRLEVWQKEEPTRVAGTLVVDGQTAVPVAADLQGHFRVPGEGGPAAELDLHSVLTVSAIGKDPGVQPPQFEPEPSVPHAVKDPLRFLGKAPAPGAPEEPSAEESDEEAPDQPAEQPTRQR